ncbi:MAG TPA: vWA domain-containing protein, partial [Acidimicrobiales bacterium]
PPVGIGVGPSLAWVVRLDAAALPVGAIDAPEGADRVPHERGSVTLSGTGLCDRDVTVRWSLAPERLTVAATVVHDEEGARGRDGDTTVNVTVVPPVGVRTRRPADVVILLDRSGSMGGWKMSTAVRAAGRLVDTLAATDRIALVAFDNVVEGDDALVPVVPETRERIHRRLDGIHARGGTELGDAVIAAAHVLGRHDPARERVIVLVTDGQVSGEAAAVAAAEATGARVVVVGVDVAVNHGLLDRLARATGGSASVVSSPQELDSALAVVRRRLGAPALERVRVELDGAVLGSLAGDHRDLVWPDSVARFGVRVTRRGEGPLPVEVVADGPDGEWRERLHASVVPTAAGRLVWARARLRAMEDDFDTGSYVEPTEIVAHSLAYGVLSRFTAFVAIDDEGERVGDGAPPLTVAQPSELPGGWAVTPMAVRSAPLRVRGLPGIGPVGATSAVGYSQGLDHLRADLGDRPPQMRNARVPAPQELDPLGRSLADLIARLRALLARLGCRLDPAGRRHRFAVVRTGEPGAGPIAQLDESSGRLECQSGSWPVAERLGLAGRVERRRAGDKAVVVLRSDDDLVTVERLLVALLHERAGSARA